MKNLNISIFVNQHINFKEADSSQVIQFIIQTPFSHWYSTDQSRGSHLWCLSLVSMV